MVVGRQGKDNNYATRFAKNFHVSSLNQVEGIFNKGLRGPSFRELISMLGLENILAPTDVLLPYLVICILFHCYLLLRNLSVGLLDYLFL